MSRGAGRDIITLMKIKKTVVKPSAGSATIADRFKLDAPDPAAVKTSAGDRKASMIALVAGLVALALSGVLTYVLYQHWEFLMPA